MIRLFLRSNAITALAFVAGCTTLRAVQFYQLKRNLARASKPARAAAYLSCRTELA